MVAFLEKFKDKNINLTKIESYINQKGLTFYVEFDGHKNDKDIKEMIQSCEGIKVIGSFVNETLGQ